jgi:hypothetical protein
MNLHWATIKEIEDIPPELICCEGLRKKLAETCGDRTIVFTDFVRKVECVCPSCGKVHDLEFTLVVYAPDNPDERGSLLELRFLDIEPAELTPKDLMAQIKSDRMSSVMSMLSRIFPYLETSPETSVDKEESHVLKSVQPPRKRPRCRGGR